MIRMLAIAALIALQSPAGALELSMPSNARLVVDQSNGPDSYALPIGPFSRGQLPVKRLEGQITRQVWRLRVQGITTLQLLAPLRDQLAAAGYQTLFECDTMECGGFDFRYGTDVTPAPDMHVDLTDFRFLAAEKGEGEHVSLLISRTANAGFVQMTSVSVSGQGTTVKPGLAAVNATSATGQSPVPATNLPVDRALTIQGHVILDDLAFETGSASLGEGSFATLAALAQFLLADPARRVALVGHTDAVGALDGNIALSKRRAASVLERLVSAYGVPRAQLEAEGMGYLAPVEPNTTDAGREANRRVEAILLNTE